MTRAGASGRYSPPCILRRLAEGLSRDVGSLVWKQLATELVENRDREACPKPRFTVRKNGQASPIRRMSARGHGKLVGTLLYSSPSALSQLATIVVSWARVLFAVHPK